jgi:hypothetical protein
MALEILGRTNQLRNAGKSHPRRRWLNAILIAFNPDQEAALRNIAHELSEVSSPEGAIALLVAFLRMLFTAFSDPSVFP